MATETFINIPGAESGGGSGVTNINGQTGPAISIVAGSGIAISSAANAITISNTEAGGTVTSVALSAPSIFTVSGSPVTTAGTLTLTLNNEAQNSVFAGPSSGGSGLPTFRVLASSDIPNNAANTTGTASNITATSNSTLTSLPSLTLPTTQLSGTLQAAQEPAHLGDVTNTAGSLTLHLVATSNSTLTTLSALSLPTSQLSGTISLTSQVSGILPSANGGTGVNNSHNLTIAGTSSVNGTFSGTSSGTNTGDQTITLTGDVTGSGTGSFAATISVNAVTNTKLAQMATQTIKGNALGTTSNPQDLTAAQVNTILGLTPSVGPTTPQSSNFTILSTAVSQTYLMNTSGGSFTATLPSAALTTNGTAYTFKDATGTAEAFPFTISPNGTDLIEGLNSPRNYVTNWGAVTYVTDGVSKWFGKESRSRLANAIFTSSGSWTCPAGVTKIKIYGRPGAGGGGGGGAGGTGFVGNPGGGGGGGGAGRPGGSASIVQAHVDVTPGTTYTITVGTGGLGGTGGTVAAGTNGGTGSTSSFDVLVTFGKNTPATGATTGGGGGAGGNGTGAAAGAAGALGGVVGTNYGLWVDAVPLSLAGAAGGTIAGGNGGNVANSVASVPLYFGVAQPGANGGTGGAGAGGTNGGGGGGGASASAPLPETFSIDGQPIASGGIGGNGGNGGLGNNGGVGGSGSNGTAGTNGVSGVGGGGGGGGGGEGSGTSAGAARGTGGNGGSGSNGIIMLEWVG